MNKQMDKKKVLFLCTGNSARSQMAEAFARRYGGKVIEAFSAGLEPKGMHPLTIRVMEEMGISISSQYSKPLEEYYGMSFDYLITVCAHADRNCPLFPGSGKRLHWEFEDPAQDRSTAGEQTEKFRKVRDQIRLKVINWLLEQKVCIEP